MTFSSKKITWPLVKINSYVFHLFSACDHEYTSQNGYIMSYNYPRGYPSNFECKYLIEAASGYIITINVTDLDLKYSHNCSLDSLEVHYVDTEAHYWPRYCGNTSLPLIRSTGNKMLFIFRSHAKGNSKRGFKLFYDTSKWR